jgi:hypothetical protein
MVSSFYCKTLKTQCPNNSCHDQDGISDVKSPKFKINFPFTFNLIFGKFVNS